MPRFHIEAHVERRMVFTPDGTNYLARFNGQDPLTLEPRLPVYIARADLPQPKVAGRDVVLVHALIEAGNARAAFERVAACVNPMQFVSNNPFTAVPDTDPDAAAIASFEEIVAASATGA